MTTDPPRYDLVKEFSSLNSSISDGFPFLKPNLNDTTVVLLATSLIDEFLKFVLISGFQASAVSKRLIETVFEGTGPLATFSAKISLCSALGLVGGDDLRHDLTILRKIRNEFAHAYSERHLYNFPQCAALRISAKVGVEDIARRQFKLSCAGIIPHLALSALINVAKGRFIADHKEQIQAEYAKMIKEVYTSSSPE